jgi:hypothetical protein
VTQPNPFQPVLTGVEQVQAALKWFVDREGLPGGFQGEVEAEMKNIVTEAHAARPRPLKSLDQEIVHALADALNELAGTLTAAQRGGEGTDVGLEQGGALLRSVRTRVGVFLTITRS